MIMFILEKCPNCFEKNAVKNGFTYQKQRFLCKNCGYNFIIQRKKYSEKIKKKAIILYLEGLGINAIGRLLGISQQIVSYWIKKYGKMVQKLKENEEKVEYDIVEIDELCSFLKNEKIKDGYGFFTIEKAKKLLILK